MPPIDFLTWCIDVLASRYGWTRDYCLKELYWKEFWKHVVAASNFTAEEMNSKLRFEFMLHADKKAANKWKDLPVPFPTKKKMKKKGSIEQLPEHLKDVVYQPDSNDS